MPDNEIKQEASNYSIIEQDTFDEEPSDITEETSNVPESGQSTFSLATFLKNKAWVLLPAIILSLAGVHINTIEFWIDMAAIIFTAHFYTKFSKN